MLEFKLSCMEEIEANYVLNLDLALICHCIFSLCVIIVKKLIGPFYWFLSSL